MKNLLSYAAKAVIILCLTSQFARTMELDDDNIWGEVIYWTLRSDCRFLASVAPVCKLWQQLSSSMIMKPSLHLQLIDNNAKQWANLLSLDLRSQEYKLTSNGLSKLTSLTCLKINNKLNILTDKILELTNLTKANFRICYLGISHIIEQLTNLTDLRIRDTKWHEDNEYPDKCDAAYAKNRTRGFSNLTNLTRLHLISHRMITDSEIKKLTNLTDLKIWSDTKVTDVGIIGLTNLKCLILDDKWKYDLPRTLTNLEHLKIRVMNPGHITKETVSLLTNLTVLDLSSKYDNEYPEHITSDWISGLTNLRKIKIRKCFEKDLSALTNLTELTAIDVHGEKEWFTRFSIEFPYLEFERFFDTST